jgi:hypothetical protein
MIEYREVKPLWTTHIYDCIYEGQDIGMLFRDAKGEYFYRTPVGRALELSLALVKDISFKLHALNWRNR